jgi:hypothetical protein
VWNGFVLLSVLSGMGMCDEQVLAALRNVKSWELQQIALGFFPIPKLAKKQ